MAITLSYTFTANTTIQSAQVNSNFSTLATRAVDKTGDTMTGDLKFTDATYDIGKTGATRPRDIFLSRNLVIGGTATVTGGQVAFPATQAASTDVNTLDDYEEGTWTPVIGGSGGTSGQTYTSQTGRYVKVGKKVHAYFNVLLSAKGTITTSAQIQGLPFTIENTGNQNPPLCITYFTGLGANEICVGGFGIINTTAATLYGIAAAGTGMAVLTTTEIGNTTQLVGAITYTATA